jgi:Fe-S cluster biogenesis protein NfuA
MARRLRDGPGEINADFQGPLSADDVRAALDAVRAGLIADGGNVEVVEVEENGTVVVELQGACRQCPAQTQTLRYVIGPRLREAVQGVTAVVAI